MNEWVIKRELTWKNQKLDLVSNLVLVSYKMHSSSCRLYMYITGSAKAAIVESSCMTCSKFMFYSLNSTNENSGWS